ncbi:hypothetical protein DSCOOX_02350 [Desulfosarcina ovata subsp. ovata]|uniref:Uncharacterized protein n=1 Tax=Desulfosarcina ovata subsp. ovata TaxID=2752305 RepID=A0A5K8A3C9_9BACT|nr:hypothetical protein DSCOOX_02350 [Desulfosarcina ovata subsp. ovata]
MSKRAPYQLHAQQACLLGYQQGNAGIGQGTVTALPISQLCDIVSHSNAMLRGREKAQPKIQKAS